MRSGTRNWRSTRGKWRRWVVVVVVKVDMVVVVVDLVVVEEISIDSEVEVEATSTTWNILVVVQATDSTKTLIDVIK